MSDEVQQGAAAVDNLEELEAHFHDLMELFEELSFREKWSKVFAGLRQPPDTGEYKWAKLQILRLWAPASAVVVPILMIVVLTIFASVSPPPKLVEVRIMDPEQTEKLDEIEQIIEEPPEPPDLTDVTFDAEVTTEQPIANPMDFSPKPVEFDSVAVVKSPIIMRGIYGSRNPGQRGSLMGRHGAPAGTEEVVLRALRWLKKYQDYDGKWMAGAGGGVNYSGGVPAAMTGLGLLTFLAHGDTPASAEFGETVEKAIRWLVEAQQGNGHFKGADGHEYGHPIATYAMCEAYGMTKIPILKDAAEKATAVIVSGCNPGGGWNYNCDKSGRNDTSYTSWCVQALKAAKMAGMQNPKLPDAIRNGVKGLKDNAAQYGGFGYTERGSTRLTGAAVLGLQLLGHSKDAEVRSGLQWMSQNSVCRWEPQKARPIYYWYYETQAFFHEGGNAWKQWNQQFATQLCRNQTVVPKAGLDGKDIGYWKSIGDAEDYGFVYNTTMCALMLQVYYRFLPTYQEIKEEAEDKNLGNEKDDIQIQIKI